MPKLIRRLLAAVAAIVNRRLHGDLKRMSLAYKAQRLVMADREARGGRGHRVVQVAR